jgi:hypothetical protein
MNDALGPPVETRGTEQREEGVAPWQRAGTQRRRLGATTFRGYVRAHDITFKRLWHMLRRGELPAKVGGAHAPISLKRYAAQQGVGIKQIRQLFREGLLPPTVTPQLPGRGQWTRISELAGLAVLYDSATQQLKALKRAIDLEAWRLASDRIRFKERHKRGLRRYRAIEKRVKLFEGALRSRDVVLSRLKHEAELGRALDGSRTVEQIVRRSLGDKAWENLMATTRAGEKKRLARAIRAAGREAEKDQAEVITNGHLR